MKTVRNPFLAIAAMAALSLLCGFNAWAASDDKPALTVFAAAPQALTTTTRPSSATLLTARSSRGIAPRPRRAMTPRSNPRPAPRFRLPEAAPGSCA